MMEKLIEKPHNKNNKSTEPELLTPRDHLLNELELGNNNTSDRSVDCKCCMIRNVRLILAYVIMVILNAVAGLYFGQAATEGYSYSFLQPDNKTFGVWGLIYTLLFLLVAFAELPNDKARDALVSAFFLNGLWLITNGLGVKGLSYWLAVFVLIAYWYNLVVVYRNIVPYNMHTCWKKVITLNAPISANMAWVTLAAILNFTNTVFDHSLDYSKRENLTRIGSPDWTIGIIGLACLLALQLMLTSGDFVFPLILSWAFFGISRNQDTTNKMSNFPYKKSQTLSDFAGLCAIAMLVGALLCFGATFLKIRIRKNERET